MTRPSDEQRNMWRYSEESDIRKEAIAWVVRLRNERVRPEERQTFERWRAQSPVHARVYEKVSGVWDDSELQAAAIQIARDSPPKHVQEPYAAPRRWFLPATGIAACAVFLVMAAVHFDLVVRLQADYRTMAGERRTIQLPDQSMVTLNTKTAIATSFDGITRRVRILRGEAFFKVQPDPERPFIVESAETATRAVGTEFVVQARDGQDQVTVLEGIVDVDSRGDDLPSTRVTAGSQIQTDQGRLGQPYSVDLSTESAWLRGRLVVNGVPLVRVIDELRRYYPGTIVLWNQDIGQVQVTGTYNLEEPGKILSLLLKTFPIRMVGVADHFVILF